MITTNRCPHRASRDQQVPRRPNRDERHRLQRTHQYQSQRQNRQSSIQRQNLGSNLPSVSHEMTHEGYEEIPGRTRGETRWEYLQHHSFVNDGPNGLSGSLYATD